MTIWKFPFAVADEFQVQMPAGSQVLSVQVQNGQPCMWAKVYEDAPFVTRRFRVYGTGHGIPEALPLDFVGTFQVQDGLLVFHLFEELDPPR